MCIEDFVRLEMKKRYLGYHSRNWNSVFMRLNKTHQKYVCVR